MKHIIDEAVSLSLHGYHRKSWEKLQEIETVGVNEALENNSVLIDKYNFNKGWHLIRQGEFNKGSQLLDHGRFVNCYGSLPLCTNKPMWNYKTDSPINKKIVVNMEGGFGDQFIFVRFVKKLKDLGFLKVYLCTDAPMVSILKRIEGVDDVIDGLYLHTFSDYDYWFPSFSLAWVTGFDSNNIPGSPYIKPKAHSYEIHKEYINSLLEKKGQLKVGLRWSGNPKFEHQQHRSFPREYMFEFSRLFPNVKFFSFQRDNDIDNIPSNIVDLNNLLTSWEDTAAALSQMDIVISSCTSIAHLSAAMGIKTFIIVPICPYYVWAENCPDEPGIDRIDYTKWYDSVVLFRQQHKDRWFEPFNNIINFLKTEFSILPTDDLPCFDKKIHSLNIGCGINKIPNCVNADKFHQYEPDLLIDFSKQYWDEIEDNSFDRIFSHHSINHINGNLDNILKEMFRISKPNAIWEIIFHHHNFHANYDDHTVVRKITKDTFNLYDNKTAITFAKKLNVTPHSLTSGIQISVIEASIEFSEYWQEQLQKNKFTEEQLIDMSNIYNNIIQNVKVIIKVNK